MALIFEVNLFIVSRITNTTQFFFISLAYLWYVLVKKLVYYYRNDTIQRHHCHRRRKIVSLAKIIQGRASFIRSGKGKLGNPRNDAGAITVCWKLRIPLHNHDRREVHHLSSQSTGIAGSDPDSLYRLSIRKLQKWIGTQGQKSLHVPRTRRVSHYIWGRPDQDACARNQLNQKVVHRTIECKNSSGDSGYPDPRRNPGTE